MIPNRHRLPLDPVERMTEGNDLGRLAVVAQATGNRSLLNVLRALRIEGIAKRKAKRK